MTQTPTDDSPGQACRKMLATRRSLVLATVDAEGRPHASLTPFVLDEGMFHILVSDLAAHTRNLQTNATVSIALMEDETESTEIFARRRAMFDCRVNPIARDTDQWTRIIAAFRERFGVIIDTLSALSDFHLMQLAPYRGTWISGFAQAWLIEDGNIQRMALVRAGQRENKTTANRTRRS